MFGKLKKFLSNYIINTVILVCGLFLLSGWYSVQVLGLDISEVSPHIIKLYVWFLFLGFVSIVLNILLYYIILKLLKNKVAFTSLYKSLFGILAFRILLGILLYLTLSIFNLTKLMIIRYALDLVIILYSAYIIKVNYNLPRKKYICFIICVLAFNVLLSVLL